MEQPHRFRGISRQRLQYTQTIEDALPVRLKDFSPQALGRTSGLIQHDGADPLLRQCQG